MATCLKKTNLHYSRILRHIGVSVHYSDFNKCLKAFYGTYTTNNKTLFKPNAIGARNTRSINKCSGWNSVYVCQVIECLATEKEPASYDSLK